MRIAQRISAPFHRENARAILWRGSPPAPLLAGSGWDVVVEETDAMEPRPKQPRPNPGPVVRLVVATGGQQPSARGIRLDN